MEIEGRVAIVTGGASGLGAAVVKALTVRGARVASLDVNEGAAGALALRCDVASEGEVNAALDRVVSALGVPSILVNCAGIGTAARVVGREGPASLAGFERVIRVNLIGSFNMIRLVGARMFEAPQDANGARGVIISTASVAAFDGQVGQAAYAASKGGIVAMTLPIAREFARVGIRVLTIAPGIFETPLLGELPKDALDTMTSAIPFPARLGRPEEFAALVESCIGNDYLNGEVIRLDGGVRLPPR